MTEDIQLSGKANDVFEKMAKITNNKDGLEALRGEFRQLDIRSRMKVLQSIECLDYTCETAIVDGAKALLGGRCTTDQLYLFTEILSTHAEAGVRSPIMDSVIGAMEHISDADFNNPRVLAEALGCAILTGFEAPEEKSYEHENPFKRQQGNKLRYISHRKAT